MIWLTIVAALAGTALALLFWRQSDLQSDRVTCQQLWQFSEEEPKVYDASLVAGLPEPAQRYFNYVIQPGTRLYRVVELSMTGELGLGTKDSPRYQQMSARQVLAPPHGLVWQLNTANMTGSDGITTETSWTRFWLFDILPIVRAGANRDHHRSAFGRVVAEAAFWAPAALLPSDFVQWQPVDKDSARAIVSTQRFTQAVDIHVAPDGRPVSVRIQRWSNENAERVYRQQPFGGYLFDFKDYAGYRLPTRVEGGNHFGTEDYFPFYKVDVTAGRFTAAG